MIVILILAILGAVACIVLLVWRLKSLKPKIRHIGPTKFTFDYEVFLDNTPAPTSMVKQGDNYYITHKGGKLIKLVGDQRITITDFKEEYPTFSTNVEGGLMCVAFSPNFAQDQKLYLSYTLTNDVPDSEMSLVVSEFTYGDNKITKVKEIVSIPAATAVHHAGTIMFGPEGYLYLSVGDGGPQQDPQNNAQNPNKYLGKILRIDMNKKDIKIVAMGLRNPWRFSIDGERMFIGDVGLNRLEEVDIMPELNPNQPYNFGWNYYEGTYKRRTGKKFSDFVPPIYEYVNDGKGSAVIGGYFVPGKKLYVFYDFGGKIFGLQFNSQKGYWERVAYREWENGKIYSSAYDGRDVYILTPGNIYRLKINPV